MLGPQKFHVAAANRVIPAYPAGAHLRFLHAKAQIDAVALPPQTIRLRNQHRKGNKLAPDCRMPGRGWVPDVPHPAKGGGKNCQLWQAQVSEAGGGGLR